MSISLEFPVSAEQSILVSPAGALQLGPNVVADMVPSEWP